MDSQYQVQQVKTDNKGLQVDWGDGHQSRFHAIWLRHQCECEVCGTSLNAVRGLRLDQLPDDLNITSLNFDSDRITLSWSDDGHQSAYQARWLRDHCYSEQERHKRKHKPIFWDGSIGDDPPIFDLHKVEGNAVVRLELLETVCDYGFCKVKNVPGTSAESNRLIEVIGTKRQTHFGNFELSNKSPIDNVDDLQRLTNKDLVNNVGDIKQALLPHCDETYRTSTIGITVFQMLQPSTEGGHSTLTDGFEAARRLKAQFPEDFDFLTRTPIPGQRYDPNHTEGELPRWYQCWLPMIQLDAESEISGVRINERQIAPLDLPCEKIEPCYRALRRFLKIVYDPELLISFALRKGEGLIFNNQRVLHGRSAFKGEQSGRVVLTNSVDLEDFYSNLRVLRAKYKPEKALQNYAQGLVA